MSLEEKLLALTEQVTQLTDAVTVLKNVMLLAQNAAPVIEPPYTTEGGTEPPTSAATVPNEQTKSSPTTDTSPPTSQASVSYDDVKAVTIAVSKIDKAKAVTGLARFGAKNAKELTEEQWASYVTYMRKVEAGELDPESSHE